MTALEMQYNFQQKFYEMNMPSRFTSYDIENFINESQNNLINELSDSFDSNDKARTFLYPLIKIWHITLVSRGTHPNGLLVTLPSDLFRCLKEQAIVDNKNRVNIKPQRHDYYTANLQNPFKQVYADLYWRLDVGKSGDGAKIHEIIVDETLSTKEYELTYLRNPQRINFNEQVDCELHELAHPIIVDNAINLALASLQRAGMIINDKQD